MLLRNTVQFFVIGWNGNLIKFLWLFTVPIKAVEFGSTDILDESSSLGNSHSIFQHEIILIQTSPEGILNSLHANRSVEILSDSQGAIKGYKPLIPKWYWIATETETTSDTSQLLRWDGSWATLRLVETNWLAR